jgi:hypothetical protein
MFTADDPSGIGQAPMHPGWLFLGRRFRTIQRLEGERNVIQRGLQKDPRVAAIPVGEPQIHQFGSGWPSTYPRYRRESALLDRQLINPELIMQCDVGGRRRRF